jgi:transcription elongation factor Elf1
MERENLNDSLFPCPFCGSKAEVKQGFDIDCESTTAVIECLDCVCSYGPIYPDDEQDVLDLVFDWNERVK